MLALCFFKIQSWPRLKKRVENEVESFATIVCDGHAKNYCLDMGNFHFIDH